MSKITASIRKIWDKLRDKSYRDGFVEDTIADHIAVQIFRMRSDKGWTQERLAEELGTGQSAVCRLEGGEQTPSVKTLLKVASAFDVALQIKFVPFSQFLIGDGEPIDREIVNFDHDHLGTWPSKTGGLDHFTVVQIPQSERPTNPGFSFASYTGDSAPQFEETIQ